MNLFPQIVKQLGLELEEEFMLEGYPKYLYKFSKDKLETKIKGVNQDWRPCFLTDEILSGKAEILKSTLNKKKLVTISFANNLYEIYNHEINHTSRCSTIEMATEITESILTNIKNDKKGNIVKDILR